MRCHQSLSPQALQSCSAATTRASGRCCQGQCWGSCGRTQILCAHLMPCNDDCFINSQSMPFCVCMHHKLSAELRASGNLYGVLSEVLEAC